MRGVPVVAARARRDRTGLMAVTLTVTMLALAGCSSSSGQGASTTTTRAAAATATAADADAAATGPPVRSSGCASAATGPIIGQRQTLDVGGVPRWYLLDTPAPDTPSPSTGTGSGTSAGQPAARPLVVDIHGLAEGATLHSQTTMFGALGQKDGFDVVFPNGTGDPVQWDTSATSHPNPDLAFMTALLDHLESTLCIDTSRVYASGFSDGSLFDSLLACTMADRFAAVAAVSGLQAPTPCRPARHIPILAINGTADPILYFNGGVGTATLNHLLGRGGTSSGTTTTTAPVVVHLHGSGFPATVQKWAVKDGCDTRSTDTRIASQVILRRYACPPGTGVEFYIVVGGGHAWPGSAFSQSISALTGYTTFQINATDAIWAFFRQYRL